MEAFWTEAVAGYTGPPKDPATAAAIAESLGRAADAQVYAESVTAEGGGILALARRGQDKRLLLAWPKEAADGLRVTFALQGERRRATLPPGPVELVDGPADAANAEALRRVLDWTAPRLIAGRPSVGLGDRLGLATPGHVRAVRGTGYVPMLAQQSIREMTRTGRSPQTVLNDATWGVFQTGWRTGFGADADHLKTAADIDRCAAAGFTFYTIDPGDHVDHTADSADAATLAGAFEALPWAALESTSADARRTFLARRVTLESGTALVLDETALHRHIGRHLEAFMRAG